MKVQASGGLWLPNTSSSEIHLKSFSECTECSNIGTELLWWRKAGPVSYVIDERFTQLFKISVLSVPSIFVFRFFLIWWYVFHKPLSVLLFSLVLINTVFLRHILVFHVFQLRFTS